MSPKKIKPKLDDQIQVTARSHFSGPIPPPDILEQYNRVIENGANRIMTMAENQSAHRIKTESEIVTADGRNSLLGIVSGFTISIGASIVAGFGFYLGYPKEAVIICTVDLAAIVGVFIYGTKNK